MKRIIFVMVASVFYLSACTTIKGTNGVEVKSYLAETKVNMDPVGNITASEITHDAAIQKGGEVLWKTIEKYGPERTLSSSGTQSLLSPL